MNASETDVIAHLIVQRVPIPEPVLERDPRLPEIVLLEHVLAPMDELDDAELVRDREVEFEPSSPWGCTSS